MASKTAETEQRNVDIVNLLLSNDYTVGELTMRVSGIKNDPQCHQILLKLETGGYVKRKDEKRGNRYKAALWAGTGKVYTAIEIIRTEDTIHKDVLGSVLKGNHTSVDIKKNLGHCNSVILKALRELRSAKELDYTTEGNTNFYTLPNVKPKKPLPVSKVSNAWAIPAVNYASN